MVDAARWWEMRPAVSNQPKTYTCPLCHRRLLAMNPNSLLSPEGDRERRRHAHTTCVAAERKAGRLLTRSEWQRSLRSSGEARPPWWRRLGRHSRT